MSVSDVSQKTVANLGWTDIKMTHPLYVGDTLYAESEVIEKRESKSRPDEGIVTVRTIGKNQDGVEVASFIDPLSYQKREKPSKIRLIIRLSNKLTFNLIQLKLGRLELESPLLY